MLVGAGLKNDLFTLSDGLNGLAEWRLRDHRNWGRLYRTDLSIYR